jgi:S-adenosylmethionine hydrolase
MTIALLTDFGTRDPYVAAMKGVIASRTGSAIADLTHDIAPFDILEAAWFLRSAAPFWPAGTIFVCVVDPGVGTDRKLIAAEHDGRLYLAPDNGLLSLVVPESAAVVSIENESYFLPSTSETFHGRDRFAPVAAALANGRQISKLGPVVDAIVRLPYQPPRYGDDRAEGTIVAVDRFGNLITDIERALLPFDDFTLHAGQLVIDRIEKNYGDAEPGAFMIVGSSGCIEISIANGSAAERLQLRRLDPVEIWKTNSQH